MMSFFSSEMFPSIGFLSEWISLYPVFYTSSFAPCVRVLGGLRGEENRAKTGEEEKISLPCSGSVSKHQQPGASRQLDGELGRWPRFLEAPPGTWMHLSEPFTPKPAMPRRVIGIPEALCLVKPWIPEV